MINLVPKESRTPSRLKQVANIFRRTSIVVLGVYALGLFFIFATSFFLNQEKNKLGNEKEQLAGDVESLKSQEKLLQVIKNRLGLAASVLAKEPLVSTKTVNDAISLVPQNIQIVALDVEGGKISLSAKTQDTKDLSYFFALLEKNERFSNVFLDSLNLEQGGFSFSLTLQ